MKRFLATTLALTTLSAAMSAAIAQNGPSVGNAHTFSDTAQVLSAQPIVERNNVPRQECSTETITTDRRVPSQGYANAGYPGASPTQPAPVAPAPQATGERSVGAGTILGAIIGGVIGHQMGSSSGGRDHGSVAGALIGGLVGNQIDNSPSSASSAPSAQPGYSAAPAPVNGPARVDYIPETRVVQNCRTVYDSRDEVTGYNVVYRYQGRDYTTRMAYDPGATLKVNVNLTPDVRR